MTNFRFSLGDSNTNGIGLCFTVKAADEAAAVKIAQQALPVFFGGLEVPDYSIDAEGIFDLNVYCGPQLTITSADVDDSYDDDATEA